MKSQVYRILFFYVPAVFALVFIQCNSPKGKESVDIKSYEGKMKNENTIRITTQKEIGWDDKSPCQVQIGKDPTILNARIKFRGGVSSKYHKHSFSFSLEKDTLLYPNFHFDNDFILNASYIDKTFLRHRLCYDIFRTFDYQEITAHCKFQELYLDDEYQGIYILMEEIDRSKCNLSKADSSALLIKDGIMFIEDTTNFYIQPGEDAFQQKFPKIQTPTHINRLSSLRTFIHNSSDQTFKDSVGYYFDLDNIQNWHFLLLFSNNGDGVVKNFYWFTKENKPWKVVPWDYDDSFGRNGDGTLNTARSGWERNALLKRLFNLNPNKYRSQLLIKMQAFSMMHKIENTLKLSPLQNYMKLYEDDLEAKAFDRNFEKWKITDSNYSDSMNRQQEIELLQNKWIEQINYLDSLTLIWETL